MTPERIAEIRDRVGRTSDGPWVPSGFSGIIDGPAYVGVINLTGFRRFYDADFVAHARQDVPDLLDALTAERQRAEAAEREVVRLLTVIEDAVQVGEMTGADFRLMPWSTLRAASDGCAALAGTPEGEPDAV